MAMATTTPQQGELELVIKTTAACNACCVYCAAQSAPGQRKRLTLDIARTLCDQARLLVRHGRYRRARLLWHGGEPLLLGKDFFRALLKFGTGPELVHALQTNLTLLDDEWIEILQPLIGDNGIGTSVDPFDDLRQLGGGGDYTDRWLQALGRVDQLGWRVGCVYVVHRRSLAHTEQLYWFFRNLRDNSTLSLRVNPLLAVGRAREADDDGLGLEPGQYGEFLKRITQQWLQDQRRLVLSPVADIVAAWEGQGYVRSCDLAGVAACVESHLGVDADGNIFNCGRSVDAGGVQFGNLHDTSLEDCLRHTSRAPLRERGTTLEAGKCGACAYWELCHGGCPYESHAEHERTDVPTALCDDYQAYFSWLEQTLGPRGAGAARATRQLHTGSVSRRRYQSDRDAERLVLDRSVDDLDQHLRAQLVATGQPLWVKPQPPGGVEAVRQLVIDGIAVVLDQPRAWSGADLKTLAEFLLRAPAARVPIEPLFAALQYRSPAGVVRTLPAIYGERPALVAEQKFRRPWLDVPCATCAAQKMCRGFWLYPERHAEQCQAWQELVALFATATQKEVTR